MSVLFSVAKKEFAPWWCETCQALCSQGFGEGKKQAGRWRDCYENNETN